MKELLQEALPFWDDLSKKEQDLLADNVIEGDLKKGDMLHYGGRECAGIQIIESGQTRVYVTSPQGGELTLFRLIDGDVSILSAACMMRGLDIEIDMEIEKDSHIVTLPKQIFKNISDTNVAVKDYMLELLSEKFSDVMWLFNQFVFSNVASRLADAILEHRALEGSDEFAITHDALARDLGTAREVVTRLLKQFQLEGLVELSRGKIKVIDAKRLGKI